MILSSVTCNGPVSFVICFVLCVYGHGSIYKPTQNQLSIPRLGIIMYNITIRNYSKENSKWNNQIEY